MKYQSRMMDLLDVCEEYNVSFSYNSFGVFCFCLTNLGLL